MKKAYEAPEAVLLTFTTADATNGDEFESNITSGTIDPGEWN